MLHPAAPTPCGSRYSCPPAALLFPAAPPPPPAEDRTVVAHDPEDPHSPKPSRRSAVSAAPLSHAPPALHPGHRESIRLAVPTTGSYVPLLAAAAPHPPCSTARR